MAVSLKLTGLLDDVGKLLAEMKKQGIIPEPESIRTAVTGFSKFITQIPDIAYTEDRVIEHEGIKVPVRIFSPDPVRELPVVVFYHGGGHMCGSVDMYDPVTRKIALASDVIVVSADYGRSPENPYPEGLNDAYAVAKRVWEVLDNVKYQERLFIGGDSAGGALATSLVMQNQDSKELNIEKQFLIYPSLDYTMSTDSYVRNGTGYLLENERIKFYFDHYFQKGEDRKKASPLFGRFSKNMPKTLVLTAEFDPLRDEGIMYYEKIAGQGIYAEHYDFPGMIHAFMNLEDLVKEEVGELYKRIAAFLKM